MNPNELAADERGFARIREANQYKLISVISSFSCSFVVGCFLTRKELTTKPHEKTSEMTVRLEGRNSLKVRISAKCGNQNFSVSASSRVTNFTGKSLVRQILNLLGRHFIKVSLTAVLAHAHRYISNEKDSLASLDWQNSRALLKAVVFANQAGHKVTFGAHESPFPNVRDRARKRSLLSFHRPTDRLLRPRELVFSRSILA